MGRLTDALVVLFKGTEAFMTEKKNEVVTTFVKETEEYTHEDIAGIEVDDLDMDSFKTVSFPNGNKLVTAKNKKNGQIQGIRMLIKKEKQ